MLPVLFRLGLFGQRMQLHSYGVAIAAGFFIAIYLGVRQTRRLGEDPAAIQELCFWLLVSSIIGARLLFVVTNLRSYGRACAEGLDSHSRATALWECTRAFHLWEGGLVFYGGLLSAIVVAVFYAARHEMNFARTADLLAPQVAVGHLFGRLGCFAAGCCWGRMASATLGLRFPPESLAFEQLVTSGELSPAATATPPLHAVQLYEALGLLGLYAGLSWLLRHKRYHGQVLVAYLVGYAVLRTITETFRGDAVRKFLIPGLSTSQAIALGSLPFAFALARYFRREQSITAGRQESL